MILSCSSCSAKYLVDNHQIKFGRHVKCIRCNHIWYFENLNYDPHQDTIKNDEKASLKQADINDSSNLPVVYKNNKKKNNSLVFILLIFLVVFYAFYTYSESSLSLPVAEVGISINKIIDYLITKIIFIFSV